MVVAVAGKRSNNYYFDFAKLGLKFTRLGLYSYFSILIKNCYVCVNWALTGIVKSKPISHYVWVLKLIKYK